jgi:hypothetical protein
MRSQVLTLTAAAALSFGLSQALAQGRWDERDRWERQAFNALDTNHDGRITRTEWLDVFDDHDLNRDRALTEDEFPGVESSAAVQTRAYRAGFERGRVDGRQAGLEDRLNHRAWDLEGQRELETADAGYTPSIGSRAEYSDGYRAGFRQAYAEGFRART